MARIQLRSSGGAVTAGGTRIGLDGGTYKMPVSATAFDPFVSVKERVRSGFDGDGNAEFVYETILSGRSPVWEIREEEDPVAGTTRVYAKVVVLGSPVREVKESSVVQVDRDGEFSVWSVTSVATLPTHVELAMERLDG